MVKLAAQLKNKFFGLIGRMSCGRTSTAHKDAAVVTGTKSVTSHQAVEIRSRALEIESKTPFANGGADGSHH